MRRLFAFAALVGLAALTAAGQDKGDAKTYTIALKKEAKGDRTKVASTDAGDVRFALSVGGQDNERAEKKTVRADYTETVLEMPEGAKKPTRLRRVYQTAEETTDGEAKKLAYHGKAVLIEKKDKDKAYRFSVGGEELAGDDAKELDDEFNKKDDVPLDNEDFLPGRPVRLDETWTVDTAKVVKSFEAALPFVLDAGKTKVTGRLTKVYDKGGRRYGAIALAMTLAVKEMKQDDQAIPMAAGSKLTADTVLDVCIDGTDHGGTEKTTLTFDLAGDLPGGKLTVTGRVKLDKTVEDLRAK